MMWLMLNKYRVYLVWFLIYALAIFAWSLGFRMAKRECAVEISSLKAAHTAELLQHEQQAKQQFQAALSEQQKWQQFAQQQSIQIAQMQQKLDAQAAQQQKEIPNVIQKDNSGGITFNGLGNDSLQHYKKSFGYTN